LGSTNIKNWTVLILLALTWGSSFILMKRALFSPTGEVIFTAPQLAALRVLIAAVVLMPISLPRFKSLLSKYFKPLLVVGLCGNFLPAFLFAFAQTKITSSLAGILNSLVPLFTLLLGVAFYNVKLRWYNATGIFLGLLGAISLILSGSSVGVFGVEVNPLYMGLVIIATLLYAISANTIKVYLSGLKSHEIASGALLMVSLPAFIILASTGFINSMQTVPYAINALGYTSILSVFGTAIAVIFYAKLIGDTNALFASTVTYLMPIIAVFWGFLDGEQLSAMQIISMLIILSGIRLVNLKR